MVDHSISIAICSYVHVCDPLLSGRTKTLGSFAASALYSGNVERIFSKNASIMWGGSWNNIAEALHLGGRK